MELRAHGQKSGTCTTERASVIRYSTAETPLGTGACRVRSCAAVPIGPRCPLHQITSSTSCDEAYPVLTLM